MQSRKEYLTEDEVTEIFSNYLIEKGWKIISRAKGQKRGIDIFAERKGKTLCIEAKGAGSQTKSSARYGTPFNKLQCDKHTDSAFACLPRMMARYKPDYVGMILPDDTCHEKSVTELLPAIKKLDAGIWLISLNSIKSLNSPF